MILAQSITPLNTIFMIMSFKKECVDEEKGVSEGE